MQYHVTRYIGLSPFPYEDLSDSESPDVDAKYEAVPEEAPTDGIEAQTYRKALKEASKLKSWFNPDPLKFVELQNPGRESVEERADFAFSMVDLVKDPESFEDAFNHPEIYKKMKWQHEISKEFEEMKSKGVWEKFKKSKIPNGRNCIKNKRIFKIKRNGIFRARLVACGYSQIPGVDFQESYALIINNVTF